MSNAEKNIKTVMDYFKDKCYTATRIDKIFKNSGYSSYDKFLNDTISTESEFKIGDLIESEGEHVYIVMDFNKVTFNYTLSYCFTIENIQQDTNKFDIKFRPMSMGNSTVTCDKLDCEARYRKIINIVDDLKNSLMCMTNKDSK